MSKTSPKDEEQTPFDGVTRQGEQVTMSVDTFGHIIARLLIAEAGNSRSWYNPFRRWER